jgi:glycosyltransferase involved in cell wall biosynthesis
MRILWLSVSPFCPTGYGKQTNYVTRFLKSAKHEVAIFAYFGLKGSKMDWLGQIPIYPNPSDDYGIQYCKTFYDDFNADCLISLTDSWVLEKLPDTMNWFPWAPIDHDPIPPQVGKTLQNHKGVVKAIAMSKHGAAEMERCHIPHFYIPHGINCSIFQPDKSKAEIARKRYGFDNKFIIGSVGTNVRERKNWVGMFTALAKFAKYHDDVLMYCHTDPLEGTGRNLHALKESLGVEKITYFPNASNVATGIEDEAMSHIYNMMDVYLQASKGEGFGIPIIEAEACGVPVIGTNWTAIPELIDGGWLLKDITREFTMQNSWEGACTPDEIVEYLEQAYQEKKSGAIEERKSKARAKAMDYDEALVFQNYWMPALEEIPGLLEQREIANAPNRAERRRMEKEMAKAGNK